MGRRIILGLVVLSACQPVAPRERYVTPWLALPYEVAQSAGRPTREGTRISAYLSIAMYEAYAAESASRLRSLGGQVNGLWSVPAAPAEGIDGATAGAEAARILLDSMLPGQSRADSLATAQFEARRRDRVGEVLRTRSMEHGRAVARAILVWSQSDGLAAVRRRAESSRPPKPLVPEAEWAALRTFVLRNADECASPPAPDYSTKPTSDFWKMAKALYDTARSATPEAVAVARYWAEDSTRADAATWTRMLRTVMTTSALAAPVAAESWVLASIAIADAEIGASRQQAREAVVAPATYVNRAIDRGWAPALPLGETTYPPGAVVRAAAAAEVLARAFGDSMTFRDSVGSSTPGRPISGFGQARDEIVAAGVVLGVRYPLVAQRGQEQGRCIGGKIVGRVRTQQ